MKTYIQLVLAGLLLFACQSPGTFKIKGAVDLANGKKVYRIIANANNQPQVIDSAEVNAGAFQFEGMIEIPDINFLQIEEIGGSLPFIAESGTISVDIFKDSLQQSIVKGTLSNDDFMQYKNDTKIYVKSINGIAKDMQQAQILNESLLFQDLQEQYLEVQNQIKDYEVDFIKTKPDSFISVLILERFLGSQSLPLEEIKSIFDQFSDRIKNTVSGKNIQEALSAPPKAEIGKLAPIFEAPNPQGEMISLANQLGTITIIDFWASWCGPCRFENPNLVQLYRKHQNQGLKILGVSLDKTKDKWVKAIEDDGLIWEQVSNLKHWQEPIAKTYQVTSIPATFVLDSEGTIIARDIRGQALYQKVDELLNGL
jgi:peroxiredoxin